MLNSNNATVATKNNVPKKATKKTQKIEETKDLLKNVEEKDMIYEILDREQRIEEIQTELENLELENATLRANAKHSDTSIKKELEETKAETEKLKLEILEIKILKEENEKIKLQAAEEKKNAELLKSELEKAKKPTHSTAEEKLNRLKKANEISLMLKRRQELFAAFKAATTGDEQDQFKITFQSSNGANFELAKSEIVTTLTKMAFEYMKQTILETEQELLSYQI